MKREIAPLTALRGIAAMAVIAMHFSATMQQLASSSFPSLAPHGELAVDVFFVLSGFIMGYTYLETFEAKPVAAASSDFFVRRIARILPLNVAVTAAVVFLSGFTFWLSGDSGLTRARPGHLAIDFFTNALMLPGIGIGYSINWPAWSVSVEFLAYFFFPLFLLGVFHRNRVVFAATCTGALACIVLVCATGPHFGPDGIHGHDFLPWRDIGRCFSEFCLGLATFRIYRSGRLQSFFERDATAIALMSLPAAIVLTRLPDLFALLFFPPLILCLSLNNGAVARILSMPFPRFLGVISYSLYLVHDNFRPAAAALVHHLHPAPLPAPIAMALAALFATSMILPAWACYQWIERPGRTLVQSWLRRAKQHDSGADIQVTGLSPDVHGRSP